jgi:hypothetical protein
MKTAFPLTLAIAIGSATAFAPSQKAFVACKSIGFFGVPDQKPTILTLCSHLWSDDITASTSLAAENTRKEFLTQAALLTGGFLFSPSQAMAAKYGSFGAGSPEVLDPTTAEIDTDILASSAVQGALKKVEGYRSIVKDMQKALESDGQANLRPIIIKNLDFAKIRDTMNTLNTAFEEDTQRGTDRLIRVILQDITELEQANLQKDGIPRSPRRLENLQGKLVKLDLAFEDYLAFAK